MRLARFVPSFPLVLVLVAGATAFPDSARADSVEIDVSKTHGKDLNRYCFRVTNDDEGDTPGLEAEKFSSVFVRFSPSGSWRDNVASPDGWDSTTTSAPAGEQGGNGSVHWEASDADKQVGPGDQQDGFCFVVRGNVTIDEVKTDYKPLLGGDGRSKVLSDPAEPNAGMPTTEENDEDFMTDSDGDGIPDIFDKRPLEPDPDGDEKKEGEDNCDETPNPDQLDADGDGLGDACDEEPLDPDRDGDLLSDGFEVHVLGTSPDLFDTDGDLASDSLEYGRGSDPLSPLSQPEILLNGIDDDGFGVIDENHDEDLDEVDEIEDNCPAVYNPDQADSDGDGVGNACEQALPLLPISGVVALVGSLALFGAVAIRGRRRTGV